MSQEAKKIAGHDKPSTTSRIGGPSSLREYVKRLTQNRMAMSFFARHTHPRLVASNFWAHRVLIGLTAAGILGTVLGVATLFIHIIPGFDLDRGSPDLDDVLRLLDHGYYDQARTLRAQIDVDGAKGISKSKSEFISGAAAAYEALELFEDGPFRERCFLVAARYLEHARKLGLPPDREPEAVYLLGLSLFKSNQYTKCIPVLQEALGLNQHRQVEIQGMLANASRWRAPPNLEDALRWKQLQLENAQLTADERNQAIQELGEIYLQSGDLDKGLRTVEKIDKESTYYGTVLALRGRLLRKKAEDLVNDRSSPTKAIAALQEAAALLRQALEHGTGSVEKEAVVSLEMALVSHRMGQLATDNSSLRSSLLAQAKQQYARTRRTYHGSDEALFAALQESELCIEEGEFDNAVELQKHVLRTAGLPGSFQNSWMTSAEMQRRILVSFRHLLEAREYRSAISLANHFTPFFSETEALEVEAAAHREWANHLIQHGTPRQSEVGKERTNAACQRFRVAGDTFMALASLRFEDREYPDCVWNAASCYHQGEDHQRALSAYLTYLENEVRRRQASALAGIGECMLSMGQVTLAITYLEQCLLDYPTNPVAYRARLSLSRCFSELGDWDRAIQLLDQNLHHQRLTPQSAEWQESLFLIGKFQYFKALHVTLKSRLQRLPSNQTSLAHVESRERDISYQAYRPAINSLNEALRRFPNAPQAIESRYLLAEAHKESALFHSPGLSTSMLAPEARGLDQTRRQSLRESRKEFENLRSLLEKRTKTDQPSPLESRILRNCYFGLGQTLLNLGRLEEAVRVYSTVTRRYQGSPECLEAYVQIARCLRRSMQYTKARGAIEQAKVALDGLPPEVNLRSTTRYDRRQWTRTLDWMGTL